MIRLLQSAARLAVTGQPETPPAPRNEAAAAVDADAVAAILARPHKDVFGSLLCHSCGERLVVGAPWKSKQSSECRCPQVSNHTTHLQESA